MYPFNDLQAARESGRTRDKSPQWHARRQRQRNRKAATIMLSAEYRGLSPRRREIVLLIVRRFANPGCDYASFPAQRTLAKLLGISQQAVKEHLKAIVKAGVLEKSQEHWSPTKRTCVQSPEEGSVPIHSDVYRPCCLTPLRGGFHKSPERATVRGERKSRGALKSPETYYYDGFRITFSLSGGYEIHGAAPGAQLDRVLAFIADLERKRAHPPPRGRWRSFLRRIVGALFRKPTIYEGIVS